MIINTNTQSLKALNSMSRSNESINNSSARLSSGLRINSAADDAAGLAISEKMRATIRGLSKADGNINDGINMLNIADSSLQTLSSSYLTRMRELAIQGANDTLTAKDRLKIQTEIDQYIEGMGLVFTDTNFNTIPIYDKEALKIRIPGAGSLNGDSIISDDILQGFKVDSNHNTMTFYYGDDPVQKKITLETNKYYTRETLIERLESEFNRVLPGHPDAISIVPYGDGIQFIFNDIFTGFGGNMMENDAIFTSILYDNVHIGSQVRPSIYNYKSFGTPLVIDSSNDSFRITVNNIGLPNPTINLNIPHTITTFGDLLSHIDTELKAYDPLLSAVSDGNRIRINYDAFQTTASFSGLTGSLFNTVSALNERTFNSEDASNAQITTNSSTGLPSTFNLPNGTNTWSVMVGGNKVEFTFGTNNVSVADIINEINNPSKDYPLTAVAYGSGIRLISKNPTDTIASDPSANPFLSTYFFSSSYTITTTPGQSKIQQGYPTEHISPPIVTGRSDAGIASNPLNVVTGVNDIFTVTINHGDGKPNQRIDITVPQASYTKDSLAAYINAELKANNADTACTIKANGQMEFRYGKNGDMYTLAVSGKGADYFMSKTRYNTSASPTSPSNAVLHGRTVNFPLEITAGSDSFTLRLELNGIPTNHTIKMPIKTYNNITELQDGLETALADSQPPLMESLIVDTSNYGSPGVRLTMDKFVPNSSISVSGNGDIMKIFRTTTVSTSSSYATSAEYDQPYIDGRVEILSKNRIIAGVNDTLTFDMNNGGTLNTYTITLPPETYSDTDLILEIQKQLDLQNIPVVASLETAVTPNGIIDPVLRLTGVSDVNASKIEISGIRGNASFTIFYTGDVESQVITSPELVYQVGANAGELFLSGLPIPLNLDILGLVGLQMTTRNQCIAALAKIDEAQAIVLSHLSKVGAKTNAISHIDNYVTKAEVDQSQAESLIRDANMAKEIMRRVRASVLQNASMMMLAQANQMPETVLQLLR